mmetsp:Transcript_9192/g.24468  ORF Transcript_9192/g.24468 Transcript_9192/m.24468 type:complete len:224 (-) Transcript_9192:426-1097(-)
MRLYALRTSTSRAKHAATIVLPAPPMPSSAVTCAMGERRDASAASLLVPVTVASSRARLRRVARSSGRSTKLSGSSGASLGTDASTVASPLFRRDMSAGGGGAARSKGRATCGDLSAAAADSFPLVLREPSRDTGVLPGGVRPCIGDDVPPAALRCRLPRLVMVQTSRTRCATPASKSLSSLRLTYRWPPSLPPTAPRQLEVSRQLASITTGIIRSTPFRRSA